MTRRATPRLALAATALVAGVLVAVLAGLPEAALLLGPWAVMLVLGVSQHRPDAVTASVAVHTDRVLVGDEIDVTVTVSGAIGAVKVSCEPGVGFWDSEGPSPEERGFAGAAAVSRGERVSLECRLPAGQWGTHDLGRVRIQVTEPYGLFRWSGMVAHPARVRVHPTPQDLQSLLAPWLVRRVAGAHGSLAVDRGIEYADIRPFASGDALRDINWRASARAQELWVSQRHPDRATDVILMLDSFVESGHDARTVVGLAIEAAVALAESHLGVTDRVGLVELGGVVRWVSPGTGSHQLQRLTDELLATRLFENAAAQGLALVPPRALPPRSFVVALTPLLDERFIDALFVLAGRGHDVAVIETASLWLEDEQVQERTSARVAFRFWEAERQVIRDRLLEHGVAIASWRAGEHLEVALDGLARRRRLTARSVRRR